MGLNKVKEGSQMYQGLVTHTWNPIRGLCPHSCSYCSIKRIYHRFNKPQSETFLDEKEFKTNLGSGNFIFVGSANDLFADTIQFKWIEAILEYCEKFDNRYLFQTKNPLNMPKIMPEKAMIATTIETNRWYYEMGKSPHPLKRTIANVDMVTIEPIMDFDIYELVEMIYHCSPNRVNIGADSGHNHLPEPPKEKIFELIAELEKFTTVYQKSNLKRLLI